MIARYCTQCGTQRTSVSARFCQCGAEHYDNPVPLVLCVLLTGQKSLLVKRARQPYRGRWAPPGGFVDAGESVDGAAVREVREETGIILSEEQLIPYSIASVPTMNQIYIIFRAHLEQEQTPIPGDEVMEAAWFAEDEIPVDDFWLPAHISSFRSLFRSVRSGQFKFYINKSSYDFSTARGLKLAEEPGKGQSS